MGSGWFRRLANAWLDVYLHLVHVATKLYRYLFFDYQKSAVRRCKQWVSEGEILILNTFSQKPDAAVPLK
jgi:hypothetical protein